MITVLPVFREEGWHSMDLCADMLLSYAPLKAALEVSIPPYQRLLGFLPSTKAKNFDRWYNRWKVYPGHVEKLAAQPGFYHIVDHSYAHLVNYLPEGRVGVYCHDLDAFKCILAPDQEPRSLWFRKMMSRVFEGLRKARLVFCSTRVTREKLIALNFWRPEAIQVVPYGIASEFQSDGPREPGEYLLHVGSCIPRKRIDLLLEIFKQINNHKPFLKLIQAGGSFSREHLRIIRDLGLDALVEQRKNLTRFDISRLYRGAKALLVTSDSEGFGLPVIEAIACGTPVVASDIPTLREAGQDLARFCSVGKVDEWVEAIEKVLSETKKEAQNANNIDDLKKIYSWKSYAESIIGFYGRLEVAS